MKWLSSLFRIRGRTNRGTFWLSHLFVAATVTVVMLGLIAVTFTGVGLPNGKVDPEALPGFVAGLVSIPIAVVALLILSLTVRICVDTRRLHDRGKSAWLLVPMMGPSLLWTLTHGPSLKVAFVLWLISGTNLVTAVMFLAMLGTSIWYWIELGFRSGDAGDNEYGPPPLGPSGALPEEFAVV